MRDLGNAIEDSINRRRFIWTLKPPLEDAKDKTKRRRREEEMEVEEEGEEKKGTFCKSSWVSS